MPANRATLAWLPGADVGKRRGKSWLFVGSDKAAEVNSVLRVAPS
jgi:hypothetical protein